MEKNTQMRVRSNVILFFDVNNLNCYFTKHLFNFQPYGEKIQKFQLVLSLLSD